MALDLCETLPETDPLTGCYGGVFMEYNLRTMLGDDGEVRSSEEGLFSPCDSLNDVFVPACVSRLPQWWGEGLLQGDKTVSSFERIGELCRIFGDVNKNVLQACFQGIGMYLPHELNYDLGRVGEFCTAASHTTEEDLWCRSTAASAAVLGSAVSLSKSLELCAFFVGEAYKYCIKHAGQSTFGPPGLEL